MKLEKGAAGVKICLLDHWLNPTDNTVDQFSQFAVSLDSSGKTTDGKQLLTPGKWQTLTFTWDASSCSLKNDSGTSIKLPLIKPTPNGISYIHFYNTSNKPNTKGLLIQSTEMKKR